MSSVRYTAHAAFIAVNQKLKIPLAIESLGTQLSDLKVSMTIQIQDPADSRALRESRVYRFVMSHLRVALKLAFPLGPSRIRVFHNFVQESLVICDGISMSCFFPTALCLLRVPLQPLLDSLFFFLLLFPLLLPRLLLFLEAKRLCPSSHKTPGFSHQSKS